MVKPGEIYGEMDFSWIFIMDFPRNNLWKNPEEIYGNLW
jgi:hypothetical protein